MKTCERCGRYMASRGDELSILSPDYGLDEICLCPAEYLEIDRILQEEDL